VRKNVICLALSAMLFALCFSAEAQQQGKLPKIGWLSPGSVATSRIELFLREFRKLGYVEGKNIAIETRYAEDKLDRLPGLADELVRLKVDVLLTPGGNGALALKNATRTIPIVFLGPCQILLKLG
jgi:putative tryptophan/tyrosine transport system substrate-binding protein